MDNNNIIFRNLKPREIKVRVDKIQDNSCTLVLYKTARCDAIILDETVGNTNWQSHQESIKNSLFTTISIKHNGEWISKSDCGDTYSNFERKKSESSDAFKRAGFLWGIGRELYTTPDIEIPLEKVSTVHYSADNEPPKIDDEFSVKEIHTVNKEIIGLSIKNRTTGEIVFSYGYLTKCPICGNYISPMRTQKGKLWKPNEILERYKMCKDCYANNMTPIQDTESECNCFNAVVKYKDNVRKRTYEGVPITQLNQQQLNTLVISNAITDETKKAIQTFLSK
jgi:hypothetical protein